MSDIETHYDPRLAGGVLRYHTWPTIQRQTVAEHTWQMLRILTTIVAGKDLTLSLLIEAIFHDAGELGPGDAPYPSKMNSPNYALASKDLERRAREQMVEEWGIPGDQLLTPNSKDILKVVDHLESWEFSLHEIELGNQHAVVMADRMLASVQQVCERIHRLHRETIEKYILKRTLTHTSLMEKCYTVQRVKMEDHIHQGLKATETKASLLTGYEAFAEVLVSDKDLTECGYLRVCQHHKKTDHWYWIVDRRKLSEEGQENCIRLPKTATTFEYNHLPCWYQALYTKDKSPMEGIYILRPEYANHW